MEFHRRERSRGDQRGVPRRGGVCRRHDARAGRHVRDRRLFRAAGAGAGVGGRLASQHDVDAGSADHVLRARRRCRGRHGNARIQSVDREFRYRSNRPRSGTARRDARQSRIVAAGAERARLERREPVRFPRRVERDRLRNRPRHCSRRFVHAQPLLRAARARTAPGDARRRRAAACDARLPDFGRRRDHFPRRAAADRRDRIPQRTRRPVLHHGRDERDCAARRR